MRIESIQLNTFRSYAGQNFETDARVVMVSGQNGTGKTSVRDAIMWALTGATCEMSGKGSNGEMLRPDFTEEAQPVIASVVLPNVGRVERHWQVSAGQSLHVTNWTGNLTVQQAALYDHLKAHEGLIRVLCDARAFLRLDHSDAKELLLGVLNVTIQAPVGVDDALVAFTLPELDATYAKAFEERKLAKKGLTRIVVPLAPAEKQYHPVEVYDQRLAQLRSELADMQREIGGTVARRAALGQQQTGIQSKIDIVLRRNVLRQTLTVSIAEAQIQLAAMPDEVGVVSAERLAFLRNRVDSLFAHTPKDGCVLDNGVQCKTPVRMFNDAIETYQAELNKADTSAPQSSGRAALLRRIEADKEDLTRMAAEGTEALQSDLDTTTAELSSLPDVTHQENDIAAKIDHIRKGERITDDAKAYFRGLRAREEGLKEKQEAEADVERLERLCNILGPSGVRVKALQDALVGFLAGVNPFLAAWGWDLAFQADPWKAIVNGREAQTYSASERYRIGVALQIAIAKSSGLNFVVCDEFDVLDLEANQALGKMLVRAGLDQVFLLRTRSDKDELPNIPGTIVYRVGKKDGRSVITEKVEGEKK